MSASPAAKKIVSDFKDGSDFFHDPGTTSDLVKAVDAALEAGLPKEVAASFLGAVWGACANEYGG